ncbi:MAG: rRNA maturation RNase YbeY [Clostridiales bacterium]|nr:rRNA maturation RNase YbeY [Clostridiales bacterium]
MIFIENLNENFEVSESDLLSIENILKHTVELQLGAIDAEISLLLCDEAEIQRLNREYRGIDSVTDVLSFPANDLEKPAENTEGLEREGETVLLGDIAICLERAREQAAEYDNSFIEELRFLAVHGCLHIMGYDHMTEEDEKEMRLMQRRALGRKEDESLD